MRSRVIAALFVLAVWPASIWAGPFGLHQGITNFTWDSDTLGAPPPETTPTTDPLPQTTIYDAVSTGSSSVLVQNVSGYTRAAQMITTEGTAAPFGTPGVAVNFIDTQFLVATQRAVLDFDITVNSMPTTGLGQVVGNAPNGQGFVFQTFNLSTSGRVFRLVYTPTSATGGNIGMRNAGGDPSLTIIGSYTNGVSDHLQLLMDFNSQTVHVWRNSLLVLADHPMVEPGTGLIEFFIFQNGSTDSTPNDVAIDNLVSFFPEPGADSGVRRGCAASPTSVALKAVPLLRLLHLRRGGADDQLLCASTPA